jgi:hypothetical protein
MGNTGDRVGLYFGFGFDLVRPPSETLIAFVPSVSIDDRSLLWMVVRSQTYYLEHILAYGSENTYYSLVIGSGSFWTDFYRWALCGGLSTILRPGLRC